ncbi:unnamed protein product, partial [Amoebophrya sp. A25]|eukprot:GSA25T00022934001.1
MDLRKNLSDAQTSEDAAKRDAQAMRREVGDLQHRCRMLQGRNATTGSGSVSQEQALVAEQVRSLQRELQQKSQALERSEGNVRAVLRNKEDELYQSEAQLQDATQLVEQQRHEFRVQLERDRVAVQDAAREEYGKRLKDAENRLRRDFETAVEQHSTSRILELEEQILAKQNQDEAQKQQQEEELARQDTLLRERGVEVNRLQDLLLQR